MDLSSSLILTLCPQRSVQLGILLISVKEQKDVALGGWAGILAPRYQWVTFHPLLSSPSKQELLEDSPQQLPLMVNLHEQGTGTAAKEVT